MVVGVAAHFGCAAAECAFMCAPLALAERRLAEQAAHAAGPGHRAHVLHTCMTKAAAVALALAQAGGQKQQTAASCHVIAASVAAFILCLVLL